MVLIIIKKIQATWDQSKLFKILIGKIKAHLLKILCPAILYFKVKEAFSEKTWANSVPANLSYKKLKVVHIEGKYYTYETQILI